MAHFKREELKCKCDRVDCDAKPMDMGTMMKAEGVRRELAEAMIVTSAERCSYWNEKVGGASDSQHPKGRAIDIKTRNSQHRARLVMLAVKHGFTTIGIAKSFVHMDDREGPLTFFLY